MITKSKMKRHSEEYFGEQRDYWWNRDFLELMAKRWRLDNIGLVLDVGCGIGHWGQLLASILPKHSKVIGVDRESDWVDKAQVRAKNLGLDKRYSYKKGDAQNLPFKDNHFDLVTCQTVLMHVKDPKAVLKEMLRVLKPKGLLMVAEPNNLASAMVKSNVDAKWPIQIILDTVKFQLICDKGKQALGEGSNSVGDFVPGYFSELGLEQIQVYISDKAWPLYPPYKSKEQQVILKQSLEWLERDFWIWDKEDTKRFFMAGDGTEKEFKEFWSRAMKYNKIYKQAYKQKNFSSGGGGMTYLVSGRKP